MAKRRQRGEPVTFPGLEPAVRSRPISAQLVILRRTIMRIAADSDPKRRKQLRRQVRRFWRRVRDGIDRLD